MEHIAVMKKSWGLTQKILTGEKRIESRWYKAKHAPWDRIKAGEVVYFKDSGEPVTVKADVEKVLQFSNLNPEIVREILCSHGKDIGLCADDILNFEMFKNKKYCILVFLKNPRKVNPFDIDKKGFGMMSAWISVDDINNIKQN